MKSNKKSMINNIKQEAKKFFTRHKPRDKRDAVRLIVLAIAIPVFLYSAGQLIYKLYRYVYEDNQMENVVDLKPEPDKEPIDYFEDQSNIDEEASEGLPYTIIKGKDSHLNKSGFLTEYEDLKAINSDLAGWINFPGFDSKPINYPILYSGDNSFYLNRDFNKKDSYAGSLFFDGSNTPYHDDPLDIDRNYVIYGHAMKNKSMFGHLTDYWGNDDSLQHTKIYIDLMNTRLEYEVISTFLCQPDFNYRQTRFLSDEQYLDYLNAMVDNSAHDFGADVTEKDKIITLSTCYRTTRRTAIIARLVSQVVYTTLNRDNMDSEKEPVAIPTYLPYEVPTPSPRPDPESSSETSDGTSSNTSNGTSEVEIPSVTPEPTGELSPTPGIPENLIGDPELDETDFELWETSDLQNLTLDTEKYNTESSSGKIDNPSNEETLVFQDVTTVLQTYGPGKYSSSAMISSTEETSEFSFRLVLECLPEAVNSDESSSISDSSSVSEDLSSDVSSSSISATASEPETFQLKFYTKTFSVSGNEWSLIGGDDEYFYSETEGIKEFVVDWGNYELISAKLYIIASDGVTLGFNFDSVRFCKFGVNLPPPEPTAEPTADPTTEPTVGPTADPTVEPTIEPSIEPTSSPTPEQEVSDAIL